jgi:hypothetical protein
MITITDDVRDITVAGHTEAEAKKALRKAKMQARKQQEQEERNTVTAHIQNLRNCYRLANWADEERAPACLVLGSSDAPSAEGRTFYAHSVRPRGAMSVGTEVYTFGGVAILTSHVSRVLADNSGVIAVEASDGYDSQWFLVSVHRDCAAFDRLPQMIADSICRLLEDE